MKILAIDTSFDACSAAILDSGRAVWVKTAIIGRGHSEVLPVMVAEGFDASSIGARDLDRIGVVTGPGAFAGIRVGLAFARALCLGTKARAVGVSSTMALAASVNSAGVNPGGDLAAVFDARRGQVYAALYDDKLRERIAPFVAAPEEAAQRLAAAAGAPIRLVGSGAALIAPHLGGSFSIPTLRDIDPISLAQIAAAAPAPSAPPSPLYLRPPDAAPSKGSLFSEGLSA